MAFQWTEESEKALSSMWDNGRSAGAIAKELGGGLTRCAVSGKIHRMGLRTRAAKAAASKPVPAPKPAPAAPASIATAVAASVPAPTESVAITELKNRGCRWSVGEKDGSFRFCGAIRPGKNVAYCDTHARLAYAPKAIRSGIDRLSQAETTAARRASRG